MKKELSDKNSSDKQQNVYEKRFYLMMRLFRIHKMLQSAKITYPESNKKSKETKRPEPINSQ
jgi:hypothetical protein